MAQIKIKERETTEYALNLPDMLRVSVQHGVVVDRREDVYWTNQPYPTINERGLSSSAT